MNDVSTLLEDISGTTKQMNTKDLFINKSEKISISTGDDVTYTLPVACIESNDTISITLDKSGTFLTLDAKIINTGDLNVDVLTTDAAYATTLCVNSVLNMEFNSELIVQNCSKIRLQSGSRLEIDWNVPIIINSLDITGSLYSLNIISTDLYDVINRVYALENAPPLVGPPGPPGVDNTYQINNLESRLIEAEATITKLVKQVSDLVTDEDEYWMHNT